MVWVGMYRLEAELTSTVEKDEEHTMGRARRRDSAPTPMTSQWLQGRG